MSTKGNKYITRLADWQVTCLTCMALACSATALEPNQILVIVNGQIPQSVQVGRYYCQKRSIPADNIISIALGVEPRDNISRQDYQRLLATTVRQYIQSLEVPDAIRCLVTTWGVPFHVSGRGPVPGMGRLVDQIQQAMDRLIGQGLGKESPQVSQLQMQLDRLKGVETHASVDSELSMVLFGEYELYRWQPNTFNQDPPGLPFRILMASRLDGPSPQIAMSLVDKAIAAENKGLKGTAYIDARGIHDRSEPGRYDQSLRDLAAWIQATTDLPVKLDDTGGLFKTGSCPDAAIYCGWYSLANYADAFDFVEGAVGFHIASFEAANLRDPTSRQWCPAMLMDGITATLGPVNEPYLAAFPLPEAFFKALLEGNCLAEAFYKTKPFNSWQMMLIGDPLYSPFASRP